MPAPPTPPPGAIAAAPAKTPPTLLRFVLAPSLHYPPARRHRSASPRHRLAADFPEHRVTYIEPSPDPVRTTRATLVDADGSEYLSTLDPRSGHAHPLLPAERSLGRFLITLHYTFFLGPTGEVIALLASVLMLVAAITGFWFYRGALRGLFRLPLRRGRNLRAALGSIHRWVGVSTLLMQLVLGGTGLWFMIEILPDALASPKPKEKKAPAPAFPLAELVSLDALAAHIRQTYPDGEILYLALPLREGDPVISRVLHRDAPVWQKRSRFKFEPRTGAVIEWIDARERPAADQASSILGPLHFGSFWATWVKWLYAITGFAPALLTVTGTWIWWRRTRKTASSAAPAPVVPTSPR
jgi:uncharacterized iron-regulated membrane protein